MSCTFSLKRIELHCYWSTRLQFQCNPAVWQASWCLLRTIFHPENIMNKSLVLKMTEDKLA
jgi:hypothetical protein